MLYSGIQRISNQEVGIKLSRNIVRFKAKQNRELIRAQLRGVEVSMIML